MPTYALTLGFSDGPTYHLRRQASSLQACVRELLAGLDDDGVAALDELCIIEWEAANHGESEHTARSEAADADAEPDAAV